MRYMEQRNGRLSSRIYVEHTDSNSALLTRLASLSIWGGADVWWMFSDTSVPVFGYEFSNMTMVDVRELVCSNGGILMTDEEKRKLTTHR